MGFLMKLVPSKKVMLVSPLSEDKVKGILEDVLRPRMHNTFSFNEAQNKTLFKGFIEDNQFKIQRIINYRNSFLPQIHGQFKSSPNGTLIILHLKVQAFVLVFMSIWFSMVSVAFVATLIGVLIQNVQPFAILVPLFMLVFAFALVHFGFNKEEEKAILELRRILGAQIH